MTDRAMIGLDDPIFHGRLRRIHARESLISFAPSPKARPSEGYFNNNLSAFRQQEKQSNTPPFSSVSSMTNLDQTTKTQPMTLMLPEYTPSITRNWSQTVLIALSLLFIMVGLYLCGITLISSSEVKPRPQNQYQMQ